MEILVYLDDEDKNNFKTLYETCQINPVECNQQKENFYFQMREKYRILIGRSWALNMRDGYAFQWDSPRDLKFVTTGFES